MQPVAASLPKWIVGCLLSLASLVFSQTALAQTWNLQVRRTSVPNSCDFSVFEPELKITNTGTGAAFLSSVFPEFSFNAAPNEIEAVHPEGIYATFFNAQGAFIGTLGAHVTGPFPQAFAEFSPDRRANQNWRVVFDPPSGTNPNNITLPAGGFATIIVTFRRAGGSFPFDVGCDDFTKVERNAPAVFTDNKFFRLRATSTQQLICERLNATTIDPNTGIDSFAPFSTGCPQ